MKFFTFSIIFLISIFFPYLCQGKPNKAFAAAVSENYLDAAILFKDSIEYDKARQVLKAGFNSTKDEEILFYLGNLEFLSGNSREAIEILRRSQDGNWLTFLYLGLAYENIGNNNLAIVNYFKSIELKNNSIALFRLAKVYRKSAQYNKAIDLFSRVIKLDSSIRLAHYYLGNCLYAQGKYEKAYNYLAKAKKFYPKDKIINKELEIVKKKLGKKFFDKDKKAKDKIRKKVKLSLYTPEREVFPIDVALGRGLEEFSFSGGGIFMISDGDEWYRGKANKLYTIVQIDGKIVLKDYDTKDVYKVFSQSLEITAQGFSDERYPFYVLDVSHGGSDFWHKKIDRTYRGNLKVETRGRRMNLINTIEAEEYLYGVLSAEIPAKSDMAALKAQAVAARTLIFRNIRRHSEEGFNFCADVHCQVYKGLLAETKATNKAVFETRGQILVSNGKAVETFYHANCGGCLSKDVFGISDYLESKIDSKTCTYPDSIYKEQKWFYVPNKVFCYKEEKASFRWQRAYDKEDFLIAFGYSINKLNQIVVKERGDCFRNKAIEIVKGRDKMIISGGLKIRNYFDRLRSNSFKVELKFLKNKKIDMIFIWGSGFGHGTGLCQDGAIGMAKEKYKYERILKHYYPGARIKTKY